MNINIFKLKYMDQLELNFKNLYNGLFKIGDSIKSHRGNGVIEWIERISPTHFTVYLVGERSNSISLDVYKVN